MSFLTRKRILSGLLAFLAVWPVMHQVLIAKWNANPWELCGFAMYVQPNLPVEVRIRAPSGELIESKHFGADAERAFNMYRAKAAAMGLLAPANELTEAFKNAGMSYTFVEIELIRPVLLTNGKLGARRASVRKNLP